MNILFDCVVGSQAYGTNIETSDTDIKGVYIQGKKKLLGMGFKYQEQVNKDKDATYYELRRFVELLASANPTMLEMLFVDRKFVLHSHEAFEILRENRQMFLTKQCLNSFGGYAIAQIKKAKGLNKKMNWEAQKVERKQPIDFCMIWQNGKSIPLTRFLRENNFNPKLCGLAGLDKMKDNYSLYYDYQAAYGDTANVKIEPLGYRGINFEDSNSIILSNIPKEQDSIGIISYNKDGYSEHCKDYREYIKWLENRNTQRYVDTQHRQQIDGKNLMHCMRLIDCGIEIAKTGNLTVFRPNREELLDIRYGKVDLNNIISEAEKKLAYMDELFKKSNLPDKVDLEKCHSLILSIRKNYK